MHIKHDKMHSGLNLRSHECVVQEHKTMAKVGADSQPLCAG
jgi:hypothetical protein